MKAPLLSSLYFTVQLAMGQTVVLQPVVTGLTGPVDIAHAGDARLFIAQRAGVIRILQPSGSMASAPFLNITERVNSNGGEQGLLGLAFDPGYSLNGFFYVNYTGGTGNGITRVSRFNVSADPNVADPTSELVLFSRSQPATNHNGGDLAFGPDGYLWFALGDGGGSGDPNNLAQNMATAHGKMLRIDVHSGAPYTIPVDNPFLTANPADTLHEIWGSGLRNPWRFSFDALTGDVWIADVGQGAREEVNFIPAGSHTGPNFGWRCYEGNATYNTTGCAPASNYVFPVIDHPHSDGSCSVIGGYVYRGASYPSLYGKYIYTDYCHGRIHALTPDGQGGWTPSTLMASGSFGLSGFGEDASGGLYVCNTATGAVFRVVDPDAVVRVDPKVFLEGPLNTSTMIMGDALRASGSIPLNEPYTALGYGNVAGAGGGSTTSGVLATTGNNAIVDWVRVELRSAAEPRIVVATHHALLQRDGDIVNGDGTMGLAFGVGPGNYYVVVRHRNHLAAMSATPIALTAAATVVDFRSAGTSTFGLEARKNVGTQRALWAGNVVADELLKYTGDGNDRDAILIAIGGSVPTNTQSGYLAEDANLDGTVRYTGAANDRDLILFNIGGILPTNTRVEQLP
jgi:glucose/arabinose dehydrogenase